MYRSLTLLFVGTMLGLSASSLHGQVTPGGRDFSLPRAEVSFAYSPTEVNAPPGQCGCFFMNGVSAEGNFRTYRAYTTVVDVTATHAGNIHNTGEPFSMLMVTGGMRVNFRMGHQRTDGWDTYHRIKPFAQGLVGFAHGFDGAFPNQVYGFRSTERQFGGRTGRDWAGCEVQETPFLPRYPGGLWIYPAAQPCRQRPEPAADFFGYHDPPEVGLCPSFSLHLRCEAANASLEVEDCLEKDAAVAGCGGPEEAAACQ